MKANTPNNCSSMTPNAMTGPKITTTGPTATNSPPCELIITFTIHCPLTVPVTEKDHFHVLGQGFQTLCPQAA